MFLSFSSLCFRRIAATVFYVLLTLPTVALATTVRLYTTLGKIDIELYDTAAPRTVANFLTYVKQGAYNGTFIHRSVPGFVIQGGGYTFDGATGAVGEVTHAAAVVNEFDSARSNLRGTVAMAKVGGNPDSATSEWFVNLADNAANLDNQNGGFTVFGRVTDAGMAVVDAIARLSTANAGGNFTQIPLVSVPPSYNIQIENLVMLTRASVVPTTADLDRLFDYLEVQYPQFIAPAKAVSLSGSGYYYRYYPATQSYIGSTQEQLYYLGPAFDGSIKDLGTVSTWLEQAAQSGY